MKSGMRDPCTVGSSSTAYIQRPPNVGSEEAKQSNQIRDAGLSGGNRLPPMNQIFLKKNLRRRIPCAPKLVGNGDMPIWEAPGRKQ